MSMTCKLTLFQVPGYSKVLINDIVLPDQGATRFATVSDLNMVSIETPW